LDKIKFKKISGNKFGTFQGVFVPSTEAILGTVLFLLLPTITGDIGLFYMLAVILLAHSITFSTAFSLADCTTNLRSVGSGGMYALARRSLGKAFGGSIGIQLFFAQAFSIGFYCIGFVEPLQPFLEPLFRAIPFFDNMSSDLQKQVLASIIYIIFFIVVMFGADFTIKIQLLILFIMISSIISIVVIPFLNISYNGEGISIGNLSSVNLFGKRSINLALFFTSFTQFFPAVTGIDAGVGMSGDLKDPRRSIVKGTFLAIIITFVVYVIVTITYSLINRDFLVTGYIDGNPKGLLLTELTNMSGKFPYNLVSIFILLGILFATSSSALSCFMTAPRTLQSLGKDGILPSFLGFLKNDFFKKGNEPRFALLVTFFFGISVIWVGNINVAAMIVGICFLIVYGWINVSAFFERISNNPTFRPTSKGHWLISLYGFLTSIFAIALFSWKIGVLIFLSQYLIFVLILRFKTENRLEGVWWGVLFSFITKGLKSLQKIVQGTKNWRPILTAITFNGENNYPDKIGYISEKIASFLGLVHMNIISIDNNILNNKSDNDIKKYNIPTCYINTVDPTESILTMVQSSHLGGFNPNTVLIEYSKKIDSVKIINKILSLGKNILILKNAEKFQKHEKIDIWWRGEKNGNLMVLLSYIINLSKDAKINKNSAVRVIRKLGETEEEITVSNEIKNILEKARVNGEILVLPHNDEVFVNDLKKVSGETDLIILGLPGNFKNEGLTKVFRLNELFFSQEIEKFNELPTILFVKSYSYLNLIEE